MDSLRLKRALTRWLVLQRTGKKTSTQRYYKEIIKAIRHAWRDILNTPVDQVNADDVARFSLRAGRFSASRWNAMVTVLRATVPAALSLKRLPVGLTRPPPPTSSNFAKLIEECGRSTRTNAGTVVNFLAHTGLRISSARNVREADVYADRIEYLAKGGRVCSVPMINGLRGVLDALKKLDDGSGYVLPRASIRRGLANACARAGLRRLTHHDFRHMFITRCIESGVDVPTLARWVGHGDGGALLSKRYFHLLDEHSRKMAKRVRI